MKIIKVIDIIGTEYDEQGQPYEEVLAQNIGVPEFINDGGISSIGPYFTKRGRLFKNVSLITYEGQQMKVVGNYEILHRLHQNKTLPVAGYYGKRK